MATYYLDYEGGSDAADGTSFANRWKTITSGATAARIAPGDTVRIMGSPAPVSLGISATWTNKSATVTLASALNALITNCDTAWTASANVTCTANTLTYRTSTGSASLAIASGFTTGKVAYFDLGSNQDYSAYQGVTFWIHCTTGTIGSGVLTLDLCSDALGATPVDTLAIPAISQSGQWVPVYIDKGSALGASIRSISVNAISDPGTVTILIDNLSTTKAAGNDCLTLRSLIGKNTAGEYFWAIRALNGTTVTLDSCPAMSASHTARGYYGTTESVTTYKRETIRTDLVASATTSVQALQDSGSAGNLITFSGGWNRTDMSTQTLETYFDGQSGFGYGIDTNSKNYFTIDNVYCVRYNYGFLLNITGGPSELGKVYAGHCQSAGVHLSNILTGLTANEIHCWGNATTGLQTLSIADSTFTKIKLTSNGNNVQHGWNISFAAGNINITTLEVYNSHYYGFYCSASPTSAGFTITTMITNDNGQAGTYFAAGIPGLYVDSFTATGNGSHGMWLSDCVGGMVFNTVSSTSNGAYGVDFSSLTIGGECTIQSLTTSGNTSGAVRFLPLGSKIRILKSSMAEATKIAPTTTAAYLQGFLSAQNYNNTAGDHRTWFYGGGSGAGMASLFSEASVRHTASGLAWKLSINNSTNINATRPVVVPLAKVYLPNGVAKTVKLWMRRTNTGLTGILRCRGGQIAGVSADVTDSIGAAADTWEEQSISLTSSEDGVVEIDIVAYGGTTYSLYYDDFSVS